MAEDSSVDVPIGGNYNFTISDFPYRDDDGDAFNAVIVQSLPSTGTLTRADGISVAPLDAIPFFAFRLAYAPPADGISVTSGYASFTYIVAVGDGLIISGPNSDYSDTVTMTIDLVSASTQTAAAGAPTITADAGITASIAGVTDINGIDISTLIWRWQQADTPMGAYGDIAGATSSDFFAPQTEQLDKYVRACVSFMDQFDTPAQEGLDGSLCSDGELVTEANLVPEVRLRLRLFLEGPLR